MSARKIAPATTAAVTSRGRTGLARSGASLASIGRPGFMPGPSPRPWDPVEAAPGGAEVPESDQGLGLFPEREDWGPVPARSDSALARAPWGPALVGVAWFPCSQFSPGARVRKPSEETRPSALDEVAGGRGDVLERRRLSTIHRARYPPARDRYLGSPLCRKASRAAGAWRSG
jgi:hypothetical protein